MQYEEANEDLLHGSPALLPNTGTVHAELVTGLPSVQPGSRFSPKKYWVPSVVVTFQYSPFSSPLAAPVSRCTWVPSSLRSRHTSADTGISSPPWPDRVSVALSEPQHRSPTPD